VSCSQKSQLFSGNEKGTLAPILMLSTKHCQVGSNTPESLRMLLEPITLIWVPDDENQMD
jgi:hypothetical protein